MLFSGSEGARNDSATWFVFRHSTLVGYMSSAASICSLSYRLYCNTGPIGAPTVWLGSFVASYFAAFRLHVGSLPFPAALGSPAHKVVVYVAYSVVRCQLVQLADESCVHDHRRLLVTAAVCFAEPGLDSLLVASLLVWLRHDTFEISGYVLVQAGAWPWGHRKLSFMYMF
jgi:hypothetical protein